MVSKSITSSLPRNSVLFRHLTIISSSRQRRIRSYVIKLNRLLTYKGLTHTRTHFELFLSGMRIVEFHQFPLFLSCLIRNLIQYCPKRGILSQFIMRLPVSGFLNLYKPRCRKTTRFVISRYIECSVYKYCKKAYPNQPNRSFRNTRCFG